MLYNRTLLIVDDEPETLKGYEEFLSSLKEEAPRKSSRRASVEAKSSQFAEDYHLLKAKSGEEAVDLVKKEIQEGRRVAAGFFDVRLGEGMDGLATIQSIRKLDPEIHCVVVTAYQDRSVEEINQLFGEEFKDQWDYLNKPFTQGEIVQKARQMTAAWNRKRQLEQINHQLIRSERLAAVGQVARGVGHEFGNILLRIMGKTDLSLMEDDVQKIHDHLKVVMSAAERAGVIVRNLQSFSRAEPMKRTTSLAAAVDQAITLINHELVKFSIRLEKEYSPAPEMTLDVGALGQVFLNLFINATHVMPRGGNVKVTVREQSDSLGRPGVIAIVADTGPGISPEVLPRIFDFAFTTKGDRGSGLGLSISKEIVETHGGTLTVETELGKGTRFMVWIPQ